MEITSVNNPLVKDTVKLHQKKYRDMFDLYIIEGYHLFEEASKFIVTGDMTQIDLPARVKSGLVESTKILEDVKGIAIIKFDKKDIVRHELVKEIVNAYSKINSEVVK